MPILEEAENFRLKEQGQRITDNAEQMGYPDKDLGFYELLGFFGVISISDMDAETMRKAETIFEFLKDSDNVIEAVIKLNSKLGKPVQLGERLDKIYSHIYSLNIEEKFDKKKETENKMKEGLIERKKEELKELKEL